MNGLRVRYVGDNVTDYTKPVKWDKGTLIARGSAKTEFQVRFDRDGLGIWNINVRNLIENKKENGDA